MATPVMDLYIFTFKCLMVFVEKNLTKMQLYIYYLTHKYCFVFIFTLHRRYIQVLYSVLPWDAFKHYHNNIKSFYGSYISAMPLLTGTIDAQVDSSTYTTVTISFLSWNKLMVGDLPPTE